MLEDISMGQKKPVTLEARIRAAIRCRAIRTAVRIVTVNARMVGPIGRGRMRIMRMKMWVVIATTVWTSGQWPRLRSCDGR